MKLAAATAILMLSAASAAASSFVTLPALTEKLGPSMIALGTSAASPSFAALGSPAPDAAPNVEMTKVASIAPDGEETIEPETPGWVLDQIERQKPALETPRQARRFKPMVIRAGLAGDAFAARPAPAAAPAPQVTTGPTDPADAPPSAPAAEPASEPQPAESVTD